MLLLYCSLLSIGYLTCFENFTTNMTPVWDKCYVFIAGCSTLNTLTGGWVFSHTPACLGQYGQFPCAAS